MVPEGTYHIVSNYGDSNAVVRSDIRVQPGKLTDITVTHRAAVITLKLVSDRGGEALANTNWTVLTPGGDVIKETVGAFPRVVLAEGDYRAIARNEGRTFEREFKVIDRRPERRRQVDDDQDADRDPRPEQWPDRGCRASPAPAAPDPGAPDRRRLRPADAALVGPAARRVLVARGETANSAYTPTTRPASHRAAGYQAGASGVSAEPAGFPWLSVSSKRSLASGTAPRGCQ